MKLDGVEVIEMVQLYADLLLNEHVHIALLDASVEFGLEFPLEVFDLILLPQLMAFHASLLLTQTLHVRLQTLKLPGRVSEWEIACSYHGSCTVNTTMK